MQFAITYSIYADRMIVYIPCITYRTFTINLCNQSFKESYNFITLRRLVIISCRVAKKVSHYQIIKKSYWSLSMRLYLFVKLKYKLSTVILFVGIRYSMRDLLSDLYNYAWPANKRYTSNTVNDVSASSGVSSPYKAVNSIPKQSLRWSFM